LSAILTKADYNIFVNQAKHWIRHLGLIDYEWEFKFQKNTKKECKFSAKVQFDLEIMPKRAEITVYKNWGKETVTTDLLSKTALHEVLHVLIHVLIAEAGLRDESAITRRVNVIYGI